MRKKITLFCAFLLIGISLAIAQAVQVTGVVVSSEDDLPVVGASILVKGTSNYINEYILICYKSVG